MGTAGEKNRLRSSAQSQAEVLEKMIAQCFHEIGATFPFSGPASSSGNNGRGLMAYVQSIKDRGGINGRKINLIALNDAFSPPKAVEQTRRLVESDEVAFIFGSSQ